MKILIRLLVGLRIMTLGLKQIRFRIRKTGENTEEEKTFCKFRRYLTVPVSGPIIAHLQRHVGDVNIVAAPLVEELDIRQLGQDRLESLLKVGTQQFKAECRSSCKIVERFCPDPDRTG